MVTHVFFITLCLYILSHVFYFCFDIQAPTALLDTSVLRSRAQLGKKRAPRTRPTRATRQSAAQAEGEGGTTEDWLYRDSTGYYSLLLHKPVFTF